MPMPLSQHPHHRLLALPLGGEPDVARLVVVLGRVVQQVGNHLGDADRVRLQPDRLRGQRHGQLVPLRLDERPGRLDAAVDRVGQLQPLLAKLDLPPHDPRHVQQVVDQPDQVLHLLLHHVPGPRGRLAVAALHAQQVQAAADRGQRVAQLVGEHGEEFVLAAVGVLDLGIEPGILDGNGRPVGNVLGQGQIGGRVMASRFRRHERDDPQRLAPASSGTHIAELSPSDRNACRCSASRANPASTSSLNAGTICDRPDRSTSAAPSPGSGPAGKQSSQCCEASALSASAWATATRRSAPSVVERIDHAPIGEEGDGQAGDPLQGALVIDQPGQTGAGVGEELEGLLRPPPLGHVAEDAGKHPPPVDAELADGQVHGKVEPSFR